MRDDRTPEQRALDAYYAAKADAERQAEKLRPMARAVLVAVLSADPRQLPEAVRGPVAELLAAANGGAA